eukprot:5331351-Pleurochrysis_carterae.AAC.1
MSSLIKSALLPPTPFTSDACAQEPAGTNPSARLREAFETARTEMRRVVTQLTEDVRGDGA